MLKVGAMRRGLGLVTGLLVSLRCVGCGDPGTPPPVANAGPPITVLSAVLTPTPWQEPTPTPAPTPTPTPTVAPDPGPELWRAQLRKADVPAGWVRWSVGQDWLTQSTDIWCDDEFVPDPQPAYIATAGVEFQGGANGPFLVQHMWQLGAEAAKYAGITVERIRDAGF